MEETLEMSLDYGITYTGQMSDLGKAEQGVLQGVLC